MRKTKEEAALTKENILKAGMKVFLLKGYSASTLDDIAKEINMTRGAVYWHFKDKEDLLGHHCSNQYDRFINEIQIELNKRISNLEKLKRVVAINFNALYDDDQFRDFIELTWFKIDARQYERLLTDKEKITEHFNDIAFKLLKKGKRSGEISKEINPLQAALALTALLNGIFRGYFVLPEKMRKKKMAKAILNNYLKTLTT